MIALSLLIPDMAECIIVATKGKGDNTGRGKFVCLNQRPQKVYLRLLRLQIRILSEVTEALRKLEDTLQVAAMLSAVGEDNSMVICLIVRYLKDGEELGCCTCEDQWRSSRVRSDD